MTSESLMFPSMQIVIMLSKSLLVGTALLAFGGGALASDDKYTKVYGASSHMCFPQFVTK